MSTFARLATYLLSYVLSCVLCWNILHILISIALKLHHVIIYIYMIKSCWELKMWFIMHLCRFLIGTIVYLQCRRAGAGCLCASRQVRPCDVILTWDIGSRQTLDKTYVGGRQSKTSFLLILNIDFKMLYCSLWRPGCSASAGNMICYNEWNKLKQECLPSLFKLNLYLAQSVSGGLIQGVTN